MEQEMEIEVQKKPGAISEDPLNIDHLCLPSMPTLGLVGAEPKKPEAPTSKLPSSSGTVPKTLPKIKNKDKEKVKKDKDGKPRIKRPYNKKRVAGADGVDVEKPPPKKRGRKSKKDLQLMQGMPDTENEKRPHKQQTPKSIKSAGRSPMNQGIVKSGKKTLGKTKKKQLGANPGPTMFDKKLFVGPHLTMKQVLEYIITDHSYCVPPDPVQAVGTNHQTIRFIFGPKNGQKPTVPSGAGMMESGDRSPIVFPNYSRSRGQLSLSSTPPPSSKLENLLKRGDVSPLTAALRHAAAKHAMDYESDVEIDVESVDAEPEKRIPYDVQKAREVMSECEKYVEFARGNDTGEDWECKVLRTGWTKSQNGLFDKVVGALHAERLSRLAYKAIGDAEPVLRRTSVDRTACRIRRIFGEYLWDTKLTQWLHGVLNESLNFDYLAIYLDVLQTLKSQCPQLVSRMMKLSVILPLQNAYGRENELSTLLSPFLDGEKEMEKSEIDFQSASTSNDAVENPKQGPSPIKNENISSQEILLPERSVVPQMKDAMQQLHSAKNAEALKALLGRQWDPFSPVLSQRLKKLSSNPIFIYITPGAILPKFSLNRRLKQYERMLRRIGQVVRICPNSSEALKCTSATSYLEKIFHLAKEKIKQMRQHHTDRPLYLVGWGSGSILAARLSVTSGPVDGVVALGFPLHSLREMHEDILKIFSGIKHPILFVIGGLAANNSLTDMDLFRKRLTCETSLVVIGSGNDNLYVNRDHREKLLVTQSYVDKNIVDEIAYFVNLHSKHNQIIAANLSMKTPQFSKSQSGSNTMPTKKSTSTPRTKKRKSDVATPGNGNNFDAYSSEDSRSVCDMVIDNASKLSSMKQFSPASRSYDYDLDSTPKFTPSKSSNKRKANYRPDGLSTPTTPSTAAAMSTGALTASQLVQQSPNTKRRMSKPSGPTQRVPLLGQQSNQGIALPSQTPEPKKDDSAGSFMHLSSPSHPPLTSLPLSLSLRQSDGALTSDLKLTPDTLAKASQSTKVAKKKSTSKSKSSRLPKSQPTESPSAAIVSAISEVASPKSSATTSTPASSLDMHKYVLKHQQLIRQFEQNRSQQNSQLYKLLSPGGTSDSSASSVTTASGSGDVVKLNFIGSQPISSAADLVGDSRTTIISKQSLVSSMSLPLIRVARTGSSEDNSSNSQTLIVNPTSSIGSSLISSLPSEVGEKILLRTNDKSIKLNASEFKQLIAAGNRGIQLFTGVGSQGQLNFMTKNTKESTDTSYNIGASVPAVSTISADRLQSVGISSPSPTLTFPSVPVPVSQNTIEPSTPTMISAAPDVSSPVGVVPFVEPGVVENLPATTDLQTVIDTTNNDVASVEPAETDEAMDVDTDDEMCDIRISSTFSVCPTSGQRVNPMVPSPQTSVAEDPASSSPFPVIVSAVGSTMDVRPAADTQQNATASSNDEQIQPAVSPKNSVTEEQANYISTITADPKPDIPLANPMPIPVTFSAADSDNPLDVESGNENQAEKTPSDGESENTVNPTSPTVTSQNSDTEDTATVSTSETTSDIASSSQDTKQTENESETATALKKDTSKTPIRRSARLKSGV